MHPDTVVLEENLHTARGLIEKLEVRIDELIKENDILNNKLIKNVVAARSQSAERIKAKENQRLEQQIKELQLANKREKERNLQLRMRAGKVFMECLDDPLLNSTGGKIKPNMYCPEDDNALMRMMDAIEA